MNADLHCHSVVSDGTLEPEALAARAKANGVELWALTDHDELGGQQRRARRRARAGLPYLNGVEISVTFARHHGAHRRPRHRQPTTQRLRRGLAATRGGREARAREMADELAKVGIAGAYEGALHYVGNPDLISRTHFARHLVESGVCADTQEVFRRFLVEGKPGFVPHRWATLRQRGDLDRRRRRRRGRSPTRRATSSRRPRSTRSSPSSRATAAAASRSSPAATPRPRPSATPARRKRVRPARLARQRLPQPRREPDRSRRPAAAAGGADAGVGARSPSVSTSRPRPRAGADNRRMSQYFEVHPLNPQPRLLKQAAQILHGRRRRRDPDRLELRARLPPRRQGRRRAAAPDPRRRRHAIT